MPNVIEIVLGVKDDASSKVSAFGKTLGTLKTAAIGFVSALGVKAIYSEFIKNTTEAQAAAAKLDATYKSAANTIGLSRRKLDEIADGLQKTTTFEDDVVKGAEAILVTFNKVQGQAFERTIKVAADLSEVFGTDLNSAIRQVGLALQAPEQGLSLLRRSGITFTDAQVELIKKLEQTGQSAKAQDLILKELESRYGGAAQAARNTLGGALAALKNTVGDLFELTRGSTSAAVGSINSLTDALANPRIKKGLDTIAAGLFKILELAAKAGAAIGNVAGAVAGVFAGSTEEEKIQAQIDRYEKLLLDAQTTQKRTRRGIIREQRAEQPAADTVISTRRLSRTQFESITFGDAQRELEKLRAKLLALKEPLEEVRVTAKKIELKPTLDEVSVSAQKIITPLQDFRDSLDDLTKTDVGRAVSDLNEKLESLNALLQAGVINVEEFGKRKAEILDKALPEVKVDAKKIYPKFEKETDALAEIIKGIWQGVGQSIQSSLSDAFYNASVSVQTFKDIVRRALADLASAAVLNSLKKLIQTLLEVAAAKKAAEGASGSSASGLLSLFGTFLGFAGGGRSDRPAIVGENGPEIVAPGAGGSFQTFNARQLAFAGGGGVSFAPQYNVTINGAKDDEEMRREFYNFVIRKSENDRRELYRKLEKNGLGRIR